MLHEHIVRNSRLEEGDREELKHGAYRTVSTLG